MRARETSGRASIDWDVGNGAEDARATSVMNVKMVSMLCWADARDSASRFWMSVAGKTSSRCESSRTLDKYRTDECTQEPWYRSTMRCITSLVTVNLPPS